MSSNFSSASTTVARPIPSNANLRRTPIIPLASLYPCCGFLCVICSFTFKQPESIGCYSRDVLCCINHEVICCKPTPEPGYRCIFCKQECLDADECITCQQMERQICCYDCRYTMPANADHPCLCTVLFFTVRIVLCLTMLCIRPFMANEFVLHVSYAPGTVLL